MCIEIGCLPPISLKKLLQSRSLDEAGLCKQKGCCHLEMLWYLPPRGLGISSAVSLLSMDLPYFIKEAWCYLAAFSVKDMFPLKTLQLFTVVCWEWEFGAPVGKLYHWEGAFALNSQTESFRSIEGQPFLMRETTVPWNLGQWFPMYVPYAPFSFPSTWQFPDICNGTVIYVSMQP